MMFDCLRSKPKTKVEEPKVSSQHPRDIRVPVGIVIGHNKRSQGASNYLGESEWVFNSRIANKMQKKLADAGIRSVIIFRPESRSYSYQCRSVGKEVRKYGCAVVFCMHFNSAGKGARGCEVLVHHKANTVTRELADLVTDELNEKLGLKERHDDGIKYVYSGHNGFGMLDVISDTDACGLLPEPCFGNYKTKESAAIFENEDRYVDILVSSIVKMGPRIGIKVDS